jgi:pyrroloquinoline quinone biosynthesis protein B
MLVKILGSAAGGGFPQWNCACPNCRGLRAGTFKGKARTQTQVAISADGDSWFLLGASPDLRAQIEATPELQPRGDAGHGIRHSPIAGVVLANAEVDHTLGLLLLRELQPLQVYATASVRQILREHNSMFAMLERAPNQITWHDFDPGTTFPLLNLAGEFSGIRCTAFPLGSHFPAYIAQARRLELKPTEASMGLVMDAPSGRKLAYLPAVPEHISIEESDVLLFDGTFWSDDELMRLQGSGQTARQMGHLPVFSEEYGDDGFSGLGAFSRSRRIYIHINNTNPMLNEAGSEYRQVREAGWEIAEDGWQFEI